MLLNKVRNYINFEKNGFFIEAGANDGISQSNTYELENNYNWKGILVEPSYNAYIQCLKNRKNSKVFNFCLVSENYENEYINGDFDGNLMSSVDGKRRNITPSSIVKTITIKKLLQIEKISHVDFFSLDTEGYEYEILKGIDFSKVLIKNFLIEIYEKDKNDIFNFLQRNGYEKPINITNYNKTEFPLWDGTHNDYLFVKK